MSYEHFIPQNIAPTGARRMGIYNARGNRVGQIPLGSLTPPAPGKKLYTFGALSDVHIVYDTAEADFRTALTYLREDAGAAFTCICGDLTDDGTAVQLAQYKAVVDGYAGNMPVYAIAGNHEDYSNKQTLLETYTGHPLYYSFEYGDDLYLMCGCYSQANDGVFTADYLQWIYETLETNRNRRCFVFEHVFPWKDSGNPLELYYFDMFSGTKGSVFQSLLEHYKNTVFFHGHSHAMYHLQELDKTTNYSDALGYRSIHIPSIAVPRDIINGVLTPVYADSEGYVVDVYPDGIHLRGHDFSAGKDLAIASYWIDTAMQNIPAGAFTDPTGTIIT